MLRPHQKHLGDSVYILFNAIKLSVCLMDFIIILRMHISVINIFYFCTSNASELSTYFKNYQLIMHVNTNMLENINRQSKQLASYEKQADIILRS